MVKEQRVRVRLMLTTRFGPVTFLRLILSVSLNNGKILHVNQPNPKYHTAVSSTDPQKTRSKWWLPFLCLESYVRLLLSHSLQSFCNPEVSGQTSFLPDLFCPKASMGFCLQRISLATGKHEWMCTLVGGEIMGGKVCCTVENVVIPMFSASSVLLITLCSHVLPCFVNLSPKHLTWKKIWKRFCGVRLALNLP